MSFSQATLKELWLSGSSGHLSPLEQVRAWALREALLGKTGGKKQKKFAQKGNKGASPGSSTYGLHTTLLEKDGDKLKK